MALCRPVKEVTKGRAIHIWNAVQKKELNRLLIRFLKRKLYQKIVKKKQNSFSIVDWNRPKGNFFLTDRRTSALVSTFLDVLCIATSYMDGVTVLVPMENLAAVNPHDMMTGTPFFCGLGKNLCCRQTFSIYTTVGSPANNISSEEQLTAE